MLIGVVIALFVLLCGPIVLGAAVFGISGCLLGSAAGASFGFGMETVKQSTEKNFDDLLAEIKAIVNQLKNSNVVEHAITIETGSTRSSTTIKPTEMEELIFSFEEDEVNQEVERVSTIKTDKVTPHLPIDVITGGRNRSKSFPFFEREKTQTLEVGPSDLVRSLCLGKN